MSSFDAAYWTKRYQDKDTAWDLGAPSTPLKEYIDQITDKNLSILIPGAGSAYEAEYLFNKGFRNVFVIDISDEPLKNIKQRFPDFPEEQLLHADFFLHEGQYDLILEQTFFCALSPTLRTAYVKQMHKLLKPSGKLVGVVFTDPLNASIPPFGASSKEYEVLFNDAFDFKVFETCYNSIKPRAGRELFINFKKK